MSKRNEGSEPHHSNQCTDERALGEAEPPTVPQPTLALEPAEKKIKWRQTFSLKGKGKEKADAHSELPSPLSPPVPSFSYTTPHPGSPLAAPPSIPAKGSSTVRRSEPPDPGPIPRPMSTMGSYVIIDSLGGESDSESYILVGREIGNLFPGEVSCAPNQADSRGSPGEDSAIKAQGHTPDKPLTCETTVAPLVTEKAVGSRHVEVDSPRSASGALGQTHASLTPTISSRSPLSHRTTLLSIPEVSMPLSPTRPPAAPVERGARSVVDDTPNASDISIDTRDRVNPQPNDTANVATGEATPTKSSPKMPASINSSSTPSEVVAYLGIHGCLNISNDLNQLQSCTLLPIWEGGLTDVYRGCMRDGSIIAIKTMKLHFDSTTRDQKTLERTARDLHTWSKCEHSNIVRLSGLVVFQDEIGMVYPWMEKGNVRRYLAQNPSVDRYLLSMQVCRGLEYLHGIGIVHGGLKGSNILMSDDGIPMLTDIGNAMLRERTLQLTYTNAIFLCSPRWTAPELIRNSSAYSTAGDVYALGMTILEILTGKVPYHNMDDRALLCAILFENSMRDPERPEGEIPAGDARGDRLWELLVQCWLYAPEKRPSTAIAAEAMKTISP